MLEMKTRLVDIESTNRETVFSISLGSGQVALNIKSQWLCQLS